MYHHRPGRDNKRVIDRHCERHTDRMAAAKYQRNSRLVDWCDHFCDGKTGFHIAAYSIQKNEQSLDITAVLNGSKLRKDVLVLCSFCIGGKAFVSFDLSDHRKQVNVVFQFGLTVFSDLLIFFSFCVFAVAVFFFRHSVSPFWSRSVILYDTEPDMQALAFCWQHNRKRENLYGFLRTDLFQFFKRSSESSTSSIG